MREENNQCNESPGLPAGPNLTEQRLGVLLNLSAPLHRAVTLKISPEKPVTVAENKQTPKGLSILFCIQLTTASFFWQGSSLKNPLS